MTKLIVYLKRNKIQLLGLLLILLLAAFFRLYKIREFVIFLGDEGRDALVVKRMIIDHKFTLLGPTASVGGFYLGPVYYYLMIPFLWAFNFDPVGPAVMVALFGVATVLLLYRAASEWFSPQIASIIALVYAVSPGVVRASRSSWNPNIMPFFALLSMYSLSRAISRNRGWWYLLAGICLGIAIQSHYLGLILGPVLAAATLVSLKPGRWLKAATLELTGFFFGASLYFAFEIRHNFPNIKTVIEFISRGGNTTGPRSLNLVWLFYDLLRRTFEAVFETGPFLTNLLLVISLAGLFTYLFLERRRKHPLAPGVKIILAWLVVGVLGIGSYKGQLHTHYFQFLYPVPFLLMAFPLTLFWRLAPKPVLAAGLVLAAFNISNLAYLQKSGSNLLVQTENIAREIIALSENRDFNFALITSGNSDHAYRYYLEILGHPPKLLEQEVTEQLIIVCEDYNNPCEPLGYPLWEVAGFGRAEIAAETTVHPGLKLYRLVHYPSSRELIGKPAPQG